MTAQGDFEFAPVCLDMPAELPDLASRIEHTAPAHLAVSPPVPVDWKAVAAEYRDLADFSRTRPTRQRRNWPKPGWKWPSSATG